MTSEDVRALIDEARGFTAGSSPENARSSLINALADALESSDRAYWHWRGIANQETGKLAEALVTLEASAVSSPSEDEPCPICGWTGPRTQYFGTERLAVAHPDGDHERDWLPRLRAVSTPPTITDDAALRELVERGVGFDMTPTFLFDSTQSVYAQWAAYARRMDDAWRARVAAVLHPGGETNG